jgi:hypothetical protein
MVEWLLLSATLPATPSALRVRVWRALKATGAGTLRDGVYLLPASAPTAQALWDIERAIVESGADAHMLVVPARNAAQEQVFRSLFDRSEAYAEFAQSVKESRKLLKTATEAEMRRSLRQLESQLGGIQATDFFPSKDGGRAAAAMAALRREVEQRLSPGEPSAADEAIERLAIDDYQGRIWATRSRPWVDRLGTAWLIRRFIDRSPTFVWLDDPVRCPKRALGYDFDGARFSHVGDRVTFEVVAHAFGLDEDPAIARVGALVHYIDVGGIPVEEAAGFEAIVRGLQRQHALDDALFDAAAPLFDALRSALQVDP